MEATGEKWCEAEVYRTAGEVALKSPEPDAAKAEAYLSARSPLRVNSRRSHGNWSQQ